ncbi:hypothetical protein Bca52824_061910 [Brassica carinata]|uniref:C3H1-type domain-containing protein n=1 Tax=Brassica carinata TaxID=52824 RepID=A0A8X7QEV8_BRACI|nr:hypothetical protein Bca52824_061910 [Brassica carinata]
MEDLFESCLQGEKPCQYYLRTGTCRFGVACKFHHPQPDNGHSTAAYAMSTFPSAGLHHAGGLTMMPTYGSLPRPQLPQSYVPIMVSPSQGLLPPQSWATYMGASNSMYGVKNQAFTLVPVHQCQWLDNQLVVASRHMDSASLDQTATSTTSVLPYPAGLPMPPSSQPTAYPVSWNYQRISLSPSRSGSKAMHNDKPDVKKGGTEERDDGSELVQDLSSPRS